LEDFSSKEEKFEQWRYNREDNRMPELSLLEDIKDLRTV